MIIVSFIFYLLLTLTIGWLAYHRTHDLSDYILGGRRLGRWTAALSAGASDMSGWLLLGLPGYAYLSGSEAGWLAAGLLLGTWLNWRFVARRLRLYSEAANNSLTLPEFFEHRFDDKRHVLRIVSAAFILLFFLFYTSSGLVAGGKLFEAVFGLPYHWAVLAGVSAILLYTLFGGFLAVSWTDLFQGLLMAAALLIVPLVLLQQVGGWNAAVATIQHHNPALLNPMSDRQGNDLPALAIVSLLAWGLGYFGQPHILARFKAIRSASGIASARRIAVSWSALTLTGATLAGLFANVLWPATLSSGDSEKVFILLINTLFHPLMAGVLLAAILAAIMSTADSQLLVCSSVLTEDFYKTLYRPAADQAKLLRMGRWTVAIMALLACIVAWDPQSKVLDLVAYAWAGFGAAFGPTLLLALYWRRMNRAGALAGIIGGGLTVVLWKWLEGGLFDLYEIVPGILVSGIAIIVVSRLSAAPGMAIQARHAQVCSLVQARA